MARLRDAVSVTTSDGAGNEVSTNVFTTPQSLVTFSGATGAAIAIANVLVALAPGLQANWLRFGSAAFVGLVVYLIGFDADLDARRQLVSLFIAAINTFVIAAAVLGVAGA